MDERRVVLDRLRDIMVTGSALDTYTYVLSHSDEIVPDETTMAVFLQHADFRDEGRDDLRDLFSYMTFEYLLERTAALGSYRGGISPLIAAVNVAPFAVVKQLVDRLTPRGVRYSAPDGNTPLHYAIALSRADVVILLVSRGADIYARNENATVTVDATAPLPLPPRWKVRYPYETKRLMKDFFDTVHVTTQIRSYDADVTNVALLERTHIGEVMLSYRLVAMVGEFLVKRPTARVSDVNNYATLEALIERDAVIDGRCLLSVGEYLFGRPQIEAAVLDNLISLRSVAFRTVSLSANCVKEVGEYLVQRKLFPYVDRRREAAPAEGDDDDDDAPEADDPEADENDRVNDPRVMRAQFAQEIDRRLEADGFGLPEGEEGARVER